MTRHATDNTQPGAGRRAVWAAGLLVAAGAGVATAHGLYQVAAAAHVPSAIAWLYPLITDGLALVAYAATSRLAAGARRYAWVIVVLAASLSGMAQAVYLAGGIDAHAVAPVGLRFGVGAWPAAAAALTAHLLHLIGTGRPGAELAPPAVHQAAALAVQSSAPLNTEPVVQPPRTTTEPSGPPVQPARTTSTVQGPAAEAGRGQSRSAGGGASARDRAQQAAHTHHARHGSLPTATELMAQAHVSRGTAGTVLKDLRDDRPSLHIVNADTDPSTSP
jgi:hypothetical protein